MANPVRIEPFLPVGVTVNIAATAASQVLALTPLINNFIGSLRLANIGSQTLFVAFGTSNTTVTAANGVPLPTGLSELFHFSEGITHVAVIAAGVGSTLYATSGNGR